MAQLPRLLRNALAGVRTDTLISSVAFSLQPKDSVIAYEGRGEPTTFYRDLEKDDRVFTALQKRYNNVLTSQISIEPGKLPGMSVRKKDRKAADRVRDQLDSMGYGVDNQENAGFATAQFQSGFNAFTLGMLDAMLMGFSVGEVLWNQSGVEIYPEEVQIRDQRRFVFNAEGDYYQLRLRTNDGVLTTESLPPRKFIVNTWGSKDDPYGLGLGHRLYWPVFFKRYDMQYWIRYLEKFAVPTVVGKHPPGADDSVREMLLEAGRRLLSDSVVVIPDDQMLEYLELVHTSISSSGFETLLKQMNKAINLVILGSELSTDIEEGGSRAAAEVHSDEEKSLALQDGKSLTEGPYATLSRWITMLNDPGAAPPRINHVFPANTLVKGHLDIVERVYSLGFDVSEEFVNKVFGQGNSEPIFTKRSGPLVTPSFGQGYTEDPAEENNSDTEE